MINAKGEWIYTNAEIAYELGLSPATINAIGRKLYGSGKVAHWTIQEVRMILEYIKSISITEETKRMQLLHNAVAECGFEPFDEPDLRKRIQTDINGIALERKFNRAQEFGDV